MRSIRRGIGRCVRGTFRHLGTPTSAGLLALGLLSIPAAYGLLWHQNAMLLPSALAALDGAEPERNATSPIGVSDLRVTSSRIRGSLPGIADTDPSGVECVGGTRLLLEVTEPGTARFVPQVAIEARHLRNAVERRDWTRLDIAIRRDRGDWIDMPWTRLAAEGLEPVLIELAQQGLGVFAVSSPLTLERFVQSRAFQDLPKLARQVLDDCVTRATNPAESDRAKQDREAFGLAAAAWTEHLSVETQARLREQLAAVSREDPTIRWIAYSNGHVQVVIVALTLLLTTILLLRALSLLVGGRIAKTDWAHTFGTLLGIPPLLGLLGTVTGLMSSSADPNGDLLSGIGYALATTAFGAVPSILLWPAFVLVRGWENRVGAEHIPNAGTDSTQPDAPADTRPACRPQEHRILDALRAAGAVTDWVAISLPELAARTDTLRDAVRASIQWLHETGWIEVESRPGHAHRYRVLETAIRGAPSPGR